MDLGGELIDTRALNSHSRARVYADHRAGRMEKLAPGFYMRIGCWRGLKMEARVIARATAAQLSLPGSRITGEAGCLINGLHTDSRADQIAVDLLVPSQAQPRRRRAVRLHKAQALLDRTPARRWRLYGHEVLVATPAGCALDSARFDGMTAGLVPLERAMHLGRASSPETDAELLARKNSHGIAHARRAAALAVPWSESPRETHSRLRLARYGLHPIQQAEIYDELGMLIGRADFLFPEVGLILEYEGRAKTEGERGRERAAHELDRSRALTNAGFLLRHINAESFRDEGFFAEIASLYRRLAKHTVPVDARLWSAPPTPEQWAAGLRYRYGRDNDFTRVRLDENGWARAETPRYPARHPRSEVMEAFPELYPGYRPQRQGRVPGFLGGSSTDPWFAA